MKVWALPSTRLNRNYSGLLKIMGVLLLLTSLVLSLCPLQLSRGHSFAFCRAVKPALLPNTEQSHGTATLGTKFLSIHFNPQPCLCSSNARVKESGYKQKDKEKTKQSTLPVLLCCCFGISKNKNLHRQVWFSQCISYRKLAGDCTRIKKKTTKKPKNPTAQVLRRPPEGSKTF